MTGSHESHHRDRRFAVVISILLIIAGIEINPGPNYPNQSKEEKDRTEAIQISQKKGKPDQQPDPSICTNSKISAIASSITASTSNAAATTTPTQDKTTLRTLIKTTRKVIEENDESDDSTSILYEIQNYETQNSDYVTESDPQPLVAERNTASKRPKKRKERSPGMHEGKKHKIQMSEDQEEKNKKLTQMSNSTSETVSTIIQDFQQRAMQFFTEELSLIQNSIAELGKQLNSKLEIHKTKIESLETQVTDITEVITSSKVTTDDLINQINSMNKTIQLLQDDSITKQQQIAILTDQLVNVPPPQDYSGDKIKKLTLRLQQCEQDIDRQENYSRRECLILTKLPILRHQQSLEEQTDLLAQLIFNNNNVTINSEAIHYLGRHPSKTATAPAIIKFTFRREADEFFQTFIHNRKALVNTPFKFTNIEKSFSKQSRLKRKILLPHHLYLKRNGESSSLHDTILKHNSTSYTVNSEDNSIQPRPTWNVQEVERQTKIYLEKFSKQSFQPRQNKGTSAINQQIRIQERAMEIDEIQSTSSTVQSFNNHNTNKDNINSLSTSIRKEQDLSIGQRVQNFFSTFSQNNNTTQPAYKAPFIPEHNTPYGIEEDEEDEYASDEDTTLKPKPKTIQAIAKQAKKDKRANTVKKMNEARAKKFPPCKQTRDPK